MRRDMAAAIDRLLASFPHEPPDAAAIRTRAQQYMNECGCAAGAIFLNLAALAALIVLIVTHSWHLSAVLWSLLGVVAASMVGKLIGIAVAVLRLRLLQRRLNRRFLAMEAADVHLH